MHRPLYRTLLAWLAAGLGTIAHGQPYGLTSRPVIGPFFDGAVPELTPSTATAWSTVVAFPNLTFLNAVGLVAMPGTNKLVVLEREGRVYQFDNTPTVATKTLVLDVSNQCQGWDDSGLLGLAFHPDFVTNRHVYVWYNWVTPGTVIGNPTTRPPLFTPSRNRLARFTLDANGVAVPGSEVVLIDQNRASVWHNGGGMFFHPADGFLYLTVGDDFNSAYTQTITNRLFSGVLRLDVDKQGGAISHPPPRRANGELAPNWPTYYIPNDNPFVGVTNALEEFYAVGLRSPHRMTLDPVSDRIFIGDVGLSSWEEVNVIEPGGAAAANFQWSTKEGSNGHLTPPFLGVSTPPHYAYPHADNNNCVIGGYVYRGTALPAIAGKYIFGDNITGNVWMLDETTTPVSRVLLATLPPGPGPNSGSSYVGLSSFGLDANNELYLCQMSSTGGRIYRLSGGGTGAGPPLPDRLSDLGLFTNLANLTPDPRLIPYDLAVPFWSDGAIKRRWAAIPTDATIGFAAHGDWSFPAGGVFVKHFDLPIDDTNPAIRRRIETRLIVKMASGNVYGATYRWREDNTDADALGDSLLENIAISTPNSLGALTSDTIGGINPPGSTNQTGNNVTIVVRGADIYGNSDQFRFAYLSRTGDFDVRTQITGLVQTSDFAKAGLMARSIVTGGSAAGSAYVFAVAYPEFAGSRNYNFEYRPTNGGSSASINNPVPAVDYPNNAFVRLRREGDTFVGYASTDGQLWTETGRVTQSMPQTLYVGLAATAHNTAMSTTATFTLLRDTRLQQWYYPSRQDCLTCHRDNVGGVLGPSTRQLNTNVLYPNGVTDNQLRAWNHVGLFHNGLLEAGIGALDRLAPASDNAAPLELRARSFLDANCAYCHRPGGVPGAWDGRFDTPLALQGIINGSVSNDLGIPGARVIAPQDLAHSLMHVRVNQVGGNQMPPLARNTIDQADADLLAAWIQSLSTSAPPSVTLTAPQPAATLLRPGPLYLAADATDAAGVTSVEFYDGTTSIGEDTAAPYENHWLGARPGPRILRAVATNTGGSTAASPAVVVNVENPATDFLARINFQPSGAALPPDYLADDGSPFGVRTGGLSYGWSRDNSPDAVERNDATAPDQRYDTLIPFQEVHGDATSTSAWEIAVPNGTYDVRVVAGDPSVHNGYLEIQVEGAPLISGTISASGSFLDATTTINVADGRVSLAPGPNAADARICFVEIMRLPAPPAVALTGVADNALFLDGDDVALGANAIDPDGAVVKVEFFDGDRKIGEATEAPFEFTWSGTLQPGTRLLRVVAYDNEGNVTTSTATVIVVYPLKLDLVSLTPQSAEAWTVQLNTTLPPGRPYVVEWTEDFVTWQPLQSGVGDGEPLVINTPVSATTVRRFYRLNVAP